MFNKKYEGVDLKLVDPFTIGTVDECDWLILELDKTIGNITEQLSIAKSKAQHGNYADPVWYHATQRALRGAKATRQSIQIRGSAIRRDERKQSHTPIERAFMDTVIRLFDPQDVEEVWDEVKKEYPGLIK